MNTVLIPISSSTKITRILEAIENYTKKDSDRIILMHAKSAPTDSELLDPISGSSEDILRKVDEEENIAFEKSVSRIKAEGYIVEGISKMGFFDQEFIALEKEMQPDLILMFTAGSHGVIQDIFGTNTSQIVQHITSPIIVIPESTDIEQLNSATVCLHMENEDLSALQKVFDFSSYLNFQLNFVKIDNNFQLDIINDQIVLDNLNSLFPGKVAEVVHKKSENIGVSLEDFSNETDTDLLILFTTKRSLIERMFHKSITRDLVLHARKPLLIFHY